MESQKQGIQIGEAVEGDYTHAINALCLRCSTKGKSSEIKMTGMWLFVRFEAGGHAAWV